MRARTVGEDLGRPGEDETLDLEAFGWDLHSAVFSREDVGLSVVRPSGLGGSRPGPGLSVVREQLGEPGLLWASRQAAGRGVAGASFPEQGLEAASWSSGRRA